MAALYLDGKPVGEGRIPGTVPMLFSGDETMDIGSDAASPVGTPAAGGQRR
jgi:arylsulfatase